MCELQETNPKRPKRERSVADMKQAGDNAPEPSRSGSGGTASPASEPTSEQRNAGSAGASADFERQPSQGHIGASSSAQNLAAVGGGVVGLQVQTACLKAWIVSPLATHFDGAVAPVDKVMPSRAQE